MIGSALRLRERDSLYSPGQAVCARHAVVGLVARPKDRRIIHLEIFVMPRNENNQPLSGLAVELLSQGDDYAAGMAFCLRRRPIKPMAPSPAASNGNAAGIGTVASSDK